MTRKNFCFNNNLCCVLFSSHYGDLGNITADGNGVAKVDITDKLVTIVGKDSVVGRTIVVRGKLIQTKYCPQSSHFLQFALKLK